MVDNIDPKDPYRIAEEIAKGGSFYKNSELLGKLYSLNPEAYRKPKDPLIIDPETPRTPPTPIEIKDRAAILAPLDEVFFEGELMDDLIIRTAVPELLERTAPIYPGVILFGPPGTGKSEFQRALCKVYESAGAYAKQVSSSGINSMFVSALASNLEKELTTANEQGEIRGLPSLLSFDEGSIFAEKAKNGASSVSKHYQEAIDVLKAHIGNDKGKWLVLAISTNQLPEDFEEAMTREGRLTSFLIGHPSQAQIARMWGHFASKYDLIKGMNGKQSEELAQLTASESGAFVSQFCKGYLAQRRKAMLVAKGYSGMIDALKSGHTLSDDEVRRTISYEGFLSDVQAYMKRVKQRNGTLEPKEKRVNGFGK